MGSERSRAMMAAANASTMKNVRVEASSALSSSARKMPASAAIAEPRAQAVMVADAGRAPFRTVSSRLSTTARIVMPSRVWWSRKRSTRATAMPVAMVTIR
jgi:hypothetical protein